MVAMSDEVLKGPKDQMQGKSQALPTAASTER